MTTSRELERAIPERVFEYDGSNGRLIDPRSADPMSALVAIAYEADRRVESIRERLFSDEPLEVAALRDDLRALGVAAPEIERWLGALSR